MSNKLERDLKEMMNVFADPKYVRQAWKSVGQAILQNPAIKPVSQFDKDGNETLGSSIEKYSYNSLKRDLGKIGEANREPTELEMILQCQIVKARYDTAAATFVRDTLGAKPVDESKVDAQINNPYEQLSDEELELIAQERERKRQLAENQNRLKSPIVDKEVEYDVVREDATIHD
jgi:hypothetical protein